MIARALVGFVARRGRVAASPGAPARCRASGADRRDGHRHARGRRRLELGRAAHRLLRVVDRAVALRPRREGARTASIVAKGGERDAMQVLANGAMFAGAAFAMVLRPDTRWIALGAGALAASAADTWATEIGTLVRRRAPLDSHLAARSRGNVRGRLG